MFCFNCGKEITNDQKFCCFCGAENKHFLNSDLNVIPNKSSSKAKINPKDIIFNREVLKNYLYNLQTLEFAKNKLEYEKANLEYRIGSLCCPQHIAPRDSWSDYGICFGGLALMIGLFLLALWIINGSNGGGFFSILLGLIKPIAIIVMIASIIISIIIIISTISSYVQDGKRFDMETQNEAQRLEIEKQERQRLSSILPHVKQDLENTNDLLNSAYSINIIPENIRGLYGVYFLYKYISTSQVSLNEAFFHFDLNEIKCKLDIIIEQQREIILKTARSNALNEKIVKQNEQNLRHAISTERNTELAAYYSQIAALNTETVAQIQNYYFFRNGF